MSLETFTNAYIEAALWSSTAYGAPEDDGSGCWDTSLESYGCDASDLAPVTLASIREDCLTFYHDNGLLLADLDDEQSGHDFWLTRNLHGAGFWDRGYPSEISKPLTAASHAYGESNLYLGDDGLIYAA